MREEEAEKAAREQRQQLVVERMKEEQRRREEAVEKWKQLYLAIKAELDDLIQRTHHQGQVWLAVINNLEENQRTFALLKRFAQEGDFFLPYPYSRSYEVLSRVFEKLFTDFRDCLTQADYYDVLARAKSRFQLFPATWLGY